MQRPRNERFEGPCAVLHPGPEHIGGIQQIERHARPLAAQPGEYVNRLSTARDARAGWRAEQQRGEPALGDRTQPAHHVRPVGGEQYGPPPEVGRTGRRERAPQVGRRQPGVGLETGEQIPGQRRHGGVAPPGQHEWHEPRARRRRPTADGERIAMAERLRRCERALTGP